MEKFYKFVEPVVCNDEVSLGSLDEDSSKEYLVLKDRRGVKVIGQQPESNDFVKVTHVSEFEIPNLVQLVHVKLFLDRLGKVDRIYNPLFDKYLPIVVTKSTFSSKEVDYIISGEDWCLIPEDFKKKSPYRNWQVFRESGVLHKSIEKDSLINYIMRVISLPWNNSETMAWGYITEEEEGKLIAGSDSVGITEMDGNKKEMILKGNGVIYRDDANYPKWQPTPDIK